MGKFPDLLRVIQKLHKQFNFKLPCNISLQSRVFWVHVCVVVFVFGFFGFFFNMLVNLEIVLISNVTGLALKLDEGL